MSTNATGSSRRQTGIVYLVCWLLALALLGGGAMLARHMLRRENQSIQEHAHLAGIQGEVDSEISDGLSALKVLIVDKCVVALVQGSTKPDNPEILTLLNGTKEITDAAVVYVMNKEGTVVGCSVYGDGKTLTGNNYAFRPYFSRAIAGEDVVYPALGVTTGTRGLYVSSPVRGEDDQIIGVVIFKIGLDGIDLATMMQGHPVVLVSPEGIVFAGNRKKWLFKAVSPLADDVRRRLQESKQFAKEPLGPLPWNVRTGAPVIDGVQYTTVSRPISLPGWEIISCYDCGNLPPLTSLQRSLLAVALAAAVLFMTLSAFLARNVQRRKRIERELAQHRHEL